MSTIFVKLMGGLGNQLFQYATGRALALHHGAKLKLDLSFFDAYKLRRYELDVYPLAAKIASRQELMQLNESPRPGPRGWLQRLRFSRQRCPVLFRLEFNPYFDAELFDLPLPLHIEGYWQSEKYFSKYRRKIIQELTPNPEIESENKELFLIAQKFDSISLHVRRGDFLSNEVANKFHGLVPMEYYHRAISHLKMRLSNPHVLIFSDDMGWVRENLKLDIPMTFVTTNGVDRAFRDIHLQSKCHHHITANSSFSWWGSWLNPRSDKIVIAPRNWLTDASGDDSRDRIPETWLRM